MAWREPDTDSTVAERFRRQARQGPSRLAIEGDVPVTYAELDAQADHIAASLAAAAPGVERIALLLGHGAPVVAGALGALRRPASVVTLNPGEPAARLAQIRAAAEAQLVLTDEPGRDLGRAAGFADEQIVLTTERTEPPAAQPPAAEPPAAQPPAAEPPAAEAGHRDGRPDQVAFLLCTSGSSGTPKVVMQTNRNMLHNVLRYSNGLSITAADRIAWLASLSGGQGLATVWTALLNGATLCPFPVAERGVTGLAAWLQARAVTVFDTIPSVLRSFARTLGAERIGGMRLVRIASEGALHSDFEIFRRHFSPEAVLASVLASSEAGIIAQALYRAGDDPAPGRLSVGTPAEGLTVLLLDESGSSVADGEPGELVIEGRFLSPGYRNDPALTARRFTTAGANRRFHSGDIASRAPDRTLTVVGRADNQVKIRGNRLQLEEVERALSAQAEVAAAAVIAVATASGNARLAAFVSLKPGRRSEATRLRRRLADTLPSFAIPGSFTVLEGLPLTPHGKVDRDRLRDLARSSEEDNAAAFETEPVPASEVEELLAGIWAQAFERPVSSDESFLELGGDSLTAAEIAAAVDEILGAKLDLQTFASDVTVASLAARLHGQAPADESALPPLRPIGRTGPLSSAQARIWHSPQHRRTDPFWSVVVPFRVRGELDVEALRLSLEELVARHEILRTSYVEHDGAPAAVVRRSGPFALPEHDLRGRADAEARFEQLLDAELNISFDVQCGPLLRVSAIRLAEREYRLLRTTHHLVHDALSWRVFFRELAALYQARIGGRPSPLGDPPPLQYLDYAAWERATLQPDSPRYRSEVDWWQRQLYPPVPELQLPFARVAPGSPSRGSPREGSASWGIAPDTSAALDRLGRAAGATFYMTRLAAYSALLCLEAGAEDLVIGTPMSTRVRAELQSMIGVFLNVALLRLRFQGEPSFREWVAVVRRTVIEASRHVSIPTERLMSDLARRGLALPRVEARFVAWATMRSMSFGGLELEPMPRRCTGGVGFRLGVNRPFEADRCWTEFDPRRYQRDAVKAFLGRLREMSAAVSAEPDRRLRELHAGLTVAA